MSWDGRTSSLSFTIIKNMTARPILQRKKTKPKLNLHELLKQLSVSQKDNYMILKCSLVYFCLFMLAGIDKKKQVFDKFKFIPVVCAVL